MDADTKTQLLAAIREHGEYHIAEGDIDRPEMDAAIAAAERGDEREARSFFLFVLVRSSHRLERPD